MLFQVEKGYLKEVACQYNKILGYTRVMGLFLAKWSKKSFDKQVR